MPKMPGVLPSTGRDAYRKAKQNWNKPKFIATKLPVHPPEGKSSKFLDISPYIAQIKEIIEKYSPPLSNFRVMITPPQVSFLKKERLILEIGLIVEDNALPLDEDDAKKTILNELDLTGWKVKAIIKFVDPETINNGEVIDLTHFQHEIHIDKARCKIKECLDAYSHEETTPFCVKVCYEKIFQINEEKNEIILQNTERCMGCCDCEDYCPEHAISMEKIIPQEFASYIPNRIINWNKEPKLETFTNPHSMVMTSDGKYLITGHGGFTKKHYGAMYKEFDCPFDIFLTPDGIVDTDALEVDRCVIRDHCIRIWNLKNYELMKTLKGHDARITTITLTPNEKYIISGSDDKTIKIWKFSPSEMNDLIDTTSDANDDLIHTIRGHDKKINSVIITPDGNNILSASDDNTIKTWDLYSRNLIETFETHEEGVTSIAISLDGKFMLSSGGQIKKNKTIKVWSMDDKTLIKELKKHKSYITSIKFSHDGSWFCSSSNDGEIIIWDYQTQKPIHALRGHKEPVTTLAISNDDEYIVSGSNDNTIKVWSVTNKKPIQTIKAHTEKINSVIISPNNQHVISGANDKTIKIWDLSTGQLKFQLKI
jgi:WD40 repeat protein/NAD-dependent dihydropyrimidine dehydrogenase PreA subunit